MCIRDRGYFDHPPMIAFLIRPGYLLFSGEAGVRLFIVLLSTATFALIVNELNEKKDIPFLILFILSFPLIHTHIAGFLAIPDVPLDVYKRQSISHSPESGFFSLF